MANEKSTGNGIGFATVLFMIFMVLKLTGNIDWSWWWVTAPLWGGVALMVAIVFFVGLLTVVETMLHKKGL